MQACYLADVMYYLNESEPRSVYTVGGPFNHTNTEVIDTAHASMKFENGEVGIFIAGDGRSGGLDFVVEVLADGNNGMVKEPGEDLVLENSEAGESKIYSCSRDGIREEIPTFIRYIRKDIESPATAKDGARATILIRKYFESIRTRDVPFLDLCLSFDRATQGDAQKDVAIDGSRWRFVVNLDLGARRTVLFRAIDQGT